MNYQITPLIQPRQITCRNIIYGTNPIIIHGNGNGRKSTVWSNLCNNVRNINFSCKRRDDYTIVTCSNLEDSILDRNLRRLQIQYMILGRGVNRWANIKKLQLLSECWHRIDTPYVIYVDSLDVLFIDDPGKVIDHFVSTECEMLFGAEVVSWPIVTESMLWDVSKHRYPSLNSGVWIGKTAFCKRLFDRIRGVSASNIPPFLQLIYSNSVKVSPSAMNADEQWVYKLLLVSNYPNIKLDHRCEVIQNLMDAHGDLVCEGA